MKQRLALFLPLLALGTSLHAADAVDANEVKLREALRAATVQLRAAEADRTQLQATQAALNDERKTLTDKFETLRKQAVAERAADEKTIASLKAQTATQDAEVARLKEALEKSEASYKQSAALATAKEAQRAKLAADLESLERKVVDRETKNLALFKVANEILTRYEKFSLGEALAAREPFVGTTRARLENLVQDYQDKLAEQRVKP